jgi:hypothetical protein
LPSGKLCDEQIIKHDCPSTGVPHLFFSKTEPSVTTISAMDNVIGNDSEIITLTMGTRLDNRNGKSRKDGGARSLPYFSFFLSKCLPILISFRSAQKTGRE